MSLRNSDIDFIFFHNFCPIHILTLGVKTCFFLKQRLVFIRIQILKKRQAQARYTQNEPH